MYVLEKPQGKGFGTSSSASSGCSNVFLIPSGLTWWLSVLRLACI